MTLGFLLLFGLVFWIFFSLLVSNYLGVYNHQLQSAEYCRVSG